jgi:hypothetical protein
MVIRPYHMHHENVRINLPIGAPERGFIYLAETGLTTWQNPLWQGTNDCNRGNA